MSQTTYCIFIDTLADGAVPSVWTGGKPCVFSTEQAAQREIAANMITRLQEFLDGERDFDDAMTVEEYIVPVTLHPDGSIADSDGRHFGTPIAARPGQTR